MSTKLATLLALCVCAACGAGSAPGTGGAGVPDAQGDGRSGELDACGVSCGVAEADVDAASLGAPDAGGSAQDGGTGASEAGTGTDAGPILTGPFDVVDYWPFDIVGTGKDRLFQYQGGLAVDFTYDASKGALELVTAQGGTWANSWYLQVSSGTVFEVEDDYPGKTYGFSPGIGWGAVQSVGDVYMNAPEYDPLECDPVTTGSGTQDVTFEARESMTVPAGTFDDVIQLAAVQVWGSTTSWLRLWLAKGVGPIAWQFTQTSAPVLATSITN